VGTAVNPNRTGTHSGAAMDPAAPRAGLVPVLLLLVTLGSLLVNFWGWDLWAPDEPRYAEVAREMFEGGPWLVPHLGGELYAEKPPLYFWLLAGSYSLFGITPFAVRIVPVLSACGTVLLTWHLGKKLFNARAGLYAAVALATSILFMHLARRGNIDSTLTLMTTASLALMWAAHAGARRGLWLAAYGLMGLAVLTKGPVGVLLPLLVVVLYLVVVGDRGGLGRMRWVPGLGLCVVVIAAWLVPAVISGGPEYARTILLKQNVGRAFTSFSHGKPPYYYVQNFLWCFLPWVFFLPQAVFLAVRRRTRERLFPVVWFALVFVFFSLVSGKRELYLLPLFPAAALLVGWFFDLALTGALPRKALAVPAVLAGLAFIAVAVLPSLAPRMFEVPERLDVLLRHLWLVAVVCGAGGVCVFGVLLARRDSAVFAGIAVTMAAVGDVVAVVIFPAMNETKTARFLCEDLLHARTDDAPVILYGDEARSGAYHFYTRLPLVVAEAEVELTAQLRAGEKTFIILSGKKYNELSAEVTHGWRLVAARQVGHRAMKIFCRERMEIQDEL